MISSKDLKSQLPHTWPVFFARHGNLTAVQRQAIPAILAGQNTLVIAATASGKTEAAIAPLMERHLFAEEAAPKRGPALRLLYICPTRALVRDLYERLTAPLESMGVFLGMKSGDTGPVSAQSPPTLLITTPESTDSLLTRAPRLFTMLRAIVLDEIHLFDHSPRGDHLRCLLRRIETIQRYHAQQTGEEMAPLQRVALSATVPDPTGIVNRYLWPEPNWPPPKQVTQGSEERATIIEVAGKRRLLADIQPLHGLEDLVTTLRVRASSVTVRKSLIFCNTRNEVEQVAAYLRHHPPYDAAVFVHYSNLDPALRREVEEGFATASVAICVSTSTLELGIDIGSIDEVVLVGPPPTTTAFLQRVGRGGRRRQEIRVLCLARSRLEELHFQAVIDLVRGESTMMAHARLYAPAYHFRPSVLVQQLFSLLKQSPTGAIRLADLRRTAPLEVEDKALEQLLRHLALTGYLQRGRPGEWRPGLALDPLLEEHEIYSNIGADPLAGVVVDAYSGRTLAQTSQTRRVGETLLMGGRTLEVIWRDRYRIGVRRGQPEPSDGELRFQTTPFAVPLEITQAVARHLGLASDQICLVASGDGAWLFHCWGDVYGTLLATLLQFHFQQDDESAFATPVNELCLRLPVPLSQLPPWNEAITRRQLLRLLPRLEPFLALGRFHALLPPALAEQAALDQCDLPRFERLYRTAKVITPSVGLRAQLLSLLG